MSKINPTYIDQKKLEIIENLKVKTNEFDERILDKKSINFKGKMHHDIIPHTIYQKERLDECRKELRAHQNAFTAQVGNPTYDSQMKQIDEVEKLKLDLARRGVPTNIDTLRRGMVLAEREEPATDGPKKYLRGDEFLMNNPFKKKKNKKKEPLKKSRSPTKRGKSKSPSKKSPRKKRVQSDEESDDKDF